MIRIEIKEIEKNEIKVYFFHRIFKIFKSIFRKLLIVISLISFFSIFFSGFEIIDYEKKIRAKSEEKKEVLLISESFLEKVSNQREINSINQAFLEEIKKEKKYLYQNNQDWWRDHKKWIEFIKTEKTGNQVSFLSSQELAENYIKLIKKILEINQLNVQSLDIELDEKLNVWKKKKTWKLILKNSKKFFLINPLNKFSKLVNDKCFGKKLVKYQLFFLDSILKIIIFNLIRAISLSSNSNNFEKLLNNKSLFKEENSQNLKSKEEMEIEIQKEISKLGDVSINFLLGILILEPYFSISELPKFIKRFNIIIFMLVRIFFSDLIAYLTEKLINGNLKNENKETIVSYLLTNTIIVIVTTFITIHITEQDQKSLNFFLILNSIISSFLIIILHFVKERKFNRKKVL